MKDFEDRVLESLSLIDNRLSSMESKMDSVVLFFNEVSSTGDILSGDVAERIGDMVRGLGISGVEDRSEEEAPDLSELLESLKDFRSKLSTITAYDVENE